MVLQADLEDFERRLMRTVDRMDEQHQSRLRLALDPVEAKLNSIDSKQPGFGYRLSELNGSVQALHDEVQQQVRRAGERDAWLQRWRQSFEEDMRHKLQALKLDLDDVRQNGSMPGGTLDHDESARWQQVECNVQALMEAAQDMHPDSDAFHRDRARLQELEAQMAEHARVLKSMGQVNPITPGSMSLEEVDDGVSGAVLQAAAARDLASQVQQLQEDSVETRERLGELAARVEVRGSRSMDCDLVDLQTAVQDLQERLAEPSALRTNPAQSDSDVQQQISGLERQVQILQAATRSLKQGAEDSNTKWQRLSERLDGLSQMPTGNSQRSEEHQHVPAIPSLIAHTPRRGEGESASADQSAWQFPLTARSVRSDVDVAEHFRIHTPGMTQSQSFSGDAPHSPLRRWLQDTIAEAVNNQGVVIDDLRNQVQQLQPHDEGDAQSAQVGRALQDLQNRVEGLAKQVAALASSTVVHNEPSDPSAQEEQIQQLRGFVEATVGEMREVASKVTEICDGMQQQQQEPTSPEVARVVSSHEELSRRLDEGLRAGATAATVDEAQARIRKLEEDCAGLAKYIHEGTAHHVASREEVAQKVETGMRKIEERMTSRIDRAQEQLAHRIDVLEGGPDLAATENNVQQLAEKVAHLVDQVEALSDQQTSNDMLLRRSEEDTTSAKDALSLAETLKIELVSLRQEVDATASGLQSSVAQHGKELSEQQKRMDDNDAAVKTSLEALNSNFRDQISLLSTPDGDPKERTIQVVTESLQEERPRLLAELISSSDAHLKSHKDAIDVEWRERLEALADHIARVEAMGMIGSEKGVEQSSVREETVRQMVAEAVEEERPRLVADAVIASDAHLKSQKEAIKADCQSELEERTSKLVAEALQEERPRLLAELISSSDAHLKSHRDALNAEWQDGLEALAGRVLHIESSSTARHESVVEQPRPQEDVDHLRREFTSLADSCHEAVSNQGAILDELRSKLAHLQPRDEGDAQFAEVGRAVQEVHDRQERIELQVAGLQEQDPSRQIQDLRDYVVAAVDDMREAASQGLAAVREEVVTQPGGASTSREVALTLSPSEDVPRREAEDVQLNGLKSTVDAHGQELLALEKRIDDHYAAIEASLGASNILRDQLTQLSSLGDDQKEQTNQLVAEALGAERLRLLAELSASSDAQLKQHKEASDAEWQEKLEALEDRFQRIAHTSSEARELAVEDHPSRQDFDMLRGDLRSLADAWHKAESHQGSVLDELRSQVQQLRSRDEGDALAAQLGRVAQEMQERVEGVELQVAGLSSAIQERDLSSQEKQIQELRDSLDAAVSEMRDEAAKASAGLQTAESQANAVERCVTFQELVDQEDKQSVEDALSLAGSLKSELAVARAEMDAKTSGLQTSVEEHGKELAAQQKRIDDHYAAIKTSLEALNITFRDQITLMSTPSSERKVEERTSQLVTEAIDNERARLLSEVLSTSEAQLKSRSDAFEAAWQERVEVLEGRITRIEPSKFGQGVEQPRHREEPLAEPASEPIINQDSGGMLRKELRVEIDSLADAIHEVLQQHHAQIQALEDQVKEQARNNLDTLTDVKKVVHKEIAEQVQQSTKSLSTDAKAASEVRRELQANVDEVQRKTHQEIEKLTRDLQSGLAAMGGAINEMAAEKHIAVHGREPANPSMLELRKSLEQEERARVQQDELLQKSLEALVSNLQGELAREAEKLERRQTMMQAVVKEHQQNTTMSIDKLQKELVEKERSLELQQRQLRRALDSTQPQAAPLYRESVR